MRRNGMKAGMHFIMMHTPDYTMWLNSIEPWDNKHGVFHYLSMDYNLTIFNSEDLVSTEYPLFYKTGRKIRKYVTTRN